MKPLIFHSQARAELDEAIAYYEERKSGLGLALLAAVERATGTIRRHPQLGAPYKATHFRSYLLQRFPYVIFYTELEDAIWIVAIAHGRRQPGYWLRRRKE
ncbi:MAG: type II toxin-antitoxin system RelE/ParE family toxin [Dehalococcoidia bacterium]